MQTTSSFDNRPAESSQNKPLSEELVAELMADDMRPEYNIDYTKAHPNRFAARLA